MVRIFWTRRVNLNLESSATLSQRLKVEWAQSLLILALEEPKCALGWTWLSLQLQTFHFLVHFLQLGLEVVYSGLPTDREALERVSYLSLECDDLATRYRSTLSDRKDTHWVRLVHKAG